MSKVMDEWIEKWMNEQRNGWMDREMDEWIEKWMNEQRNG